MVSRSSHLRTKIVALLVSLCALWAFAAWVTLREGLNLLWVQTYDSEVYQPSEPLLLELQAERRLAMEYLARPDGSHLSTLEGMRQRNESLAEDFQLSAQGWRADVAADIELRERIDGTVQRLTELRETRQAVIARRIDRAAAERAYTVTINSIFQVFDALGNLDERGIADDAATLIDLNRARELISQQDALIAGVTAANRITAAEQARFVQLVGAERFVVAEAADRLPDADRARYDEMTDGAAFARFRYLQDRIVQAGRSGTPAPVTGADWHGATESALAELHAVVLAGGDDLVARATPVATMVIIRVILAAGLGLFAVIASIIVSITTARALVTQLQRLRDAAHQLAAERLPDVVNRIGRGDVVDVAREAPPLALGDDEIGQVGQAFNRVQETAIRTAVDQAELRRSVRDVFLSLARRTQALVHRQLTLLDAMERREADADELEDLFRVDHLATRMRRNAENLIVLSGSTPGRTWRRDVPMIDVIRGAVAEVEDYTRVTVLPVGHVALAGRSVGDVIHLLAELIENALSFSPPHTVVHIKGQVVANGYAIEIEDRGLGMTLEERAEANERITSHPEFRLSSAVRLGLFVVSRLTERSGIRVQLKESPYGGTTAVVLIPTDLVTEPEPQTGVVAGRTGHDAAAPRGTGSPAAALSTRTAVSENGRARTPGSAIRAVAPVTPVAMAEPPTRPHVDAVGGPPAPFDVASTTGRVPADIANPQQAPAGGPPPPPPVASPPGRPGTEATPPAEAAYTPSGLPVRVRPSSAQRSTGGSDPDPADGPGQPTGTARPPEKVLHMMSAYQTGTRRGRSDAARLRGDDPPGAPEDAPLALPDDPPRH